MSNDACAVEWCISLTKAGSRFCVLHALRPPLYSLEKQNDWMIRVRAEDRKAEHDRKKAEDEAAEKLEQERAQRKNRHVPEAL